MTGPESRLRTCVMRRSLCLLLNLPAFSMPSPELGRNLPGLLSEKVREMHRERRVRGVRQRGRGAKQRRGEEADVGAIFGYAVSVATSARTSSSLTW